MIVKNYYQAGDHFRYLAKCSHFVISDYLTNENVHDEPKDEDKFKAGGEESCPGWQLEQDIPCQDGDRH